MQQFTLRHKRILIVLGVIGVAFWLMYTLPRVFNPFLLALALAYILNPTIDMMVKRHIPRKVAIAGLFASIFLLTTAAIILVVPKLAEEAKLWQVQVAGEPFTDTDGNGLYKALTDPEIFEDVNKNEKYDFGEPFTDTDGDLKYTQAAQLDIWDMGTQDINGNGKYDAGAWQIALKTLQKSDAEGNPVKAILIKFMPEKKADKLLKRGIESTKKHITEISSTLGSWVGKAWQKWASAVFEGGLNTMAWVFNIGLFLLLTPVYLAFLLNSLTSGWDSFVSHTPAAVRPRMLGILKKIDMVLAAFFRGRLLVCTSIGIFSAIGFWACGVKFGLLFGLAIGILSFIPFLNVLGLIPALISCWMDGFTPTDYAFVLGIYAIGQGLDPLITSVVLGKDLQLHPITILLSLFACSALFGFLGMLLAVPIVATAKILGQEFLLPSLKALADEKMPAKKE